MIPLQTQEQFEELLRPNKAPSTVKKYEPAVGVAFGATWCGPCRTLAPIIAEIAKEFEGKAAVYDVDVDKEQNLAGEFSIRGVPATFFLKDGKLVNTLVGLQSKKAYVDVLNSLLK